MTIHQAYLEHYAQRPTSLGSFTIIVSPEHDKIDALGEMIFLDSHGDDCFITRLGLELLGNDKNGGYACAR